MSITEDLQAQFALDPMAKSISYTPSGGQPATINALVSYGNEGIPEGRYSMEHASVQVSAADVANPGEGDTVAIDGNTWTVRGILSGAFGVWELDCTRAEKAVF